MADNSSTTTTIATTEESTLITSTTIATTVADLITPTPETDSQSELRFIFVPLTVLVLILLLTAMIFSFIRKKRVDRLRHHLMPMYSFAPGEDEADWEAELLEEGSDQRKGYKSMEYPRSDSTELFANPR